MDVGKMRGRKSLIPNAGEAGDSLCGEWLL